MVDELAARVARIAAALEGDERSAFEAGLDAGRNGPTSENCAIRHFAKRERNEAWERGHALGLAERAQQEAARRA